MDYVLLKKCYGSRIKGNLPQFARTLRRCASYINHIPPPPHPCDAAIGGRPSHIELGEVLFLHCLSSISYYFEEAINFQCVTNHVLYYWQTPKAAHTEPPSTPGPPTTRPDSPKTPLERPPPFKKFERKSAVDFSSNNNQKLSL